MHLDDAEVESDLKAWEAVFSFNESDVNLSGFEGPFVEELCQVFVHMQ
jgi:hypothetical protein